jgi:tyrosine-protein kinase Etk/Wzc
MIPTETYPHQSTALDEEELSQRESVRFVGVALLDKVILVAHRKWMVAKVTGIGLLVGTIVSVLLPVRFTATTRIMTPQQTPSSATLLMSQLANSGAGSLAAAATGGGAFGLKNPNDIYIGLLNSRPVEDGIIQQFDLVKVYRASDMTLARSQLAENTSITSEKSGLLAIAVTDRDKTRAAGIANAYTTNLRNLSKTLAISEASQRKLFYEDQLKSAKDQLDNAAVAFQQVQQKNGLIQLDAQAKALIGGLANLQAEVAAKEVQIQSQRSYSTEHNPDVQLAERELDSLRAQVSKLEEKGHSGAHGDLGLKDVPNAGLAYLSAEHEVQYRQILFDLLLKQYDAARLDEARYASIIQVVETATPPDRKSFPSRIPIVLIFGFLALVGACSYLILCDLARTDTKLARSISELRLALIGR